MAHPIESYLTYNDIGGICFAFVDEDPRYMVDSEGSVYGPQAGPLVTSLRRDGYPMVRLGRTTGKAVHRLIAKAFAPNPENKPDVAHADNNKNNPAASNLRWVTRTENMADKKIHGTYLYGETCLQSKLTADDVAFIKSCKGKYLGVQLDLAEVFDVHKATINDILMGKTWVTDLTRNEG